MVNIKWTPKEDQKLTEAVKECGAENWTLIAKIVGTKTNKQCWERWNNCLDPNIKRGPWTPEEDELLLRLQEKFGNQWTKMRPYFNGRTYAQLKYRYNILTKKMKTNPFDNDTSLQTPPQVQQPQTTAILETNISQTFESCPPFLSIDNLMNKKPQPSHPQTTTTQKTITQTVNQLLLLRSANRESDITFKPFLPQKEISKE